MGARSAIALVAGLCGIASGGDPTPKEVDVKGYRDKLFVLEDAQGGTLIVEHSVVIQHGQVVARDETVETTTTTRNSVNEDHVFYGPSDKAVYAQVKVTTSGSVGAGGIDPFSLGVWVPKSDGLSPAQITRREDGSFDLFCPNVEPARIPLKQVSAERAKQVIAKAKFYTTRIIRGAQRLARDDAGVYYYVDHIRKDYGGHGERLFVGKKGAMKEVPLTDTVADSGGEVYSTKTGDVRFVFDNNEPDKNRAAFVKGDKRTELRILDLDVNSRLIYRDLGIYGPLGTLCEAY